MEFSVAMCTYNGARFLKAQLESLARQTVRPVELQIGDDGSSDETIALVKNFASSAPFPVCLHQNPSRLGYGENFIATALRCKGEWIAFCDQDIFGCPRSFQFCAAIIDEGPADLHLIAHDAEVVDESLTARRSALPI